MGRPKGSKNKPKSAVKTKSQAVPQQEPAVFRDEITIIIIFAVSAFLLLSNLGFCGLVGSVLKNIQLGLFGTIGYAFPVILSFSVVFILANIDNPYITERAAASLFMLVFISAILQLTVGGGAEDLNLLDFYRQGAENGVGGGMIGGALALLLYAIAGQIGAMLILLVATFICLIFVTGKPLASMLTRNSMIVAGKAKDRAKADFTHFSENARQYREERRQLKEDRRASDAASSGRGVDFNAINLLGTPSEQALREADLRDLPFPEDETSGFMDRAIHKAQVENAETYKIPETPSEKPALAPAPEAIQTSDSTVLPAETEESCVPSSADIFTGSISGPYHQETENTTVTDPFSGLTIREVPAGETSETPAPVLSEDLSSDITDADSSPIHNHFEDATDPILEDLEEPENTLPAETEDDMELSDLEEAALTGNHLDTDDRGRITLSSGDPVEGTRRVVTSSGQVIETDVEDLQKKVITRQEQEKLSNTPTEADNLKTQQEILKSQNQKPKKPYKIPPLHLLQTGGQQDLDTEEEIKQNAIILQQTLKSFGVGVMVTNVSVGPAVTRYELQPEIGVKVSRIVSLTNDIKMRLAAADIRIEAPIPGKSAVGIEVPNKHGATVYLGDIFRSREFQDAKAKIAFGVGKDIAGKTIITDIAKMPHLLIAGATGSGKSVSINTLIMSILYKYKPEDVRMIMVDPKVVELSVYNGIPHLLIPVVTDPKKAAAALNWAVAEMTDRYKKFAESGSRDLKGYNEKVERVRQDPDIPEDKKPEKLPQIVIIIDELADLMMVSSQEVEDAICRIAQLARAAGMHLVIATQRPTVDVITGLIKANVPSRIAFAVSSGTDSRTIIDMNGAEKLLGKGDMLFFPQGIPKPVRVQGAFVSDQEVQAVVDYIKDTSDASYSEAVATQLSSSGSTNGPSGQNDCDELFAEAGALIIESEKASIGMLQRKFRIGFNRAARIMDQLADAHVVGPEEGTKPRKILMSLAEFNQLVNPQ